MSLSHIQLAWSDEARQKSAETRAARKKATPAKKTRVAKALVPSSDQRERGANAIFKGTKFRYISPKARLNIDQMTDLMKERGHTLTFAEQKDIPKEVQQADLKNKTTSYNVDGKWVSGADIKKYLSSEDAKLVVDDATTNSKDAKSQINTPEFKHWFGDSKVVDKSTGKPLVVYHGSNADFKDFDANKIGSNLDPGDWGHGFYFGAKDTATAYGKNLHPVYLAIKNPLVLKGDYQLTDEADAKNNPFVKTLAKVLDKKLVDKMVEEKSNIPEFIKNVVGADKFTEALKSKGYDGVIVKYSDDVKHFEAIAFYPHQIKPAIGNKGKFELSQDPWDENLNLAWTDEAREKSAESRKANAKGKPQLVSKGKKPTAELAKEISQHAMPHTAPKDTQAFKNWFGSSKVVDDEDKPLVVFHGTTHDIKEFAPAGDKHYQPESNFGAGIYFTSSPEDMSENYAGVGPDLTNRIQARAEELENEGDGVDPEKAKEQAIKELSGGTAVGMPVYISMQHPFVVGKSENNPVKETFLTSEYAHEDEDDPDSDIIGVKGTLVDFAQSLKEIADNEGYSDADIDSFVGELLAHGADSEGMRASELDKFFRENEHMIYVSDQYGKLVNSELFRKGLEKAGFDGVIDRTVDSKFGTTSKYAKMKGVNPDTTHYIAFKPEQIKSAIGNKGTFDPKSKDITLSV